MIEVRIVSFWGDIYWEGAMSRDVLYLELDGGYIGKRRWKNSSTPHLISVHFTVCILYLKKPDPKILKINNKNKT